MSETCDRLQAENKLLREHELTRRKIGSLEQAHAEVRRLRAKIEMRERQLALAATHISKLYEGNRNEHMPQEEKDHRLRMVYALGADFKRIVEEEGAG